MSELTISSAVIKWNSMVSNGHKAILDNAKKENNEALHCRPDGGVTPLSIPVDTDMYEALLYPAGITGNGAYERACLSMSQKESHKYNLFINTHSPFAVAGNGFLYSGPVFSTETS